MQPTPELERLFNTIPSGKAFEKYYYSQPEDFQLFMNLIANAPKEELGQVITLLEQKRGDAAKEAALNV